MGYKSKLLYELDYLEYVLETGMWDDEATILTDKEIEDLKRRIEDVKEDIETDLLLLGGGYEYCRGKQEVRGSVLRMG